MLINLIAFVAMFIVALVVGKLFVFYYKQKGREVDLMGIYIMGLIVGMVLVLLLKG